MANSGNGLAHVLLLKGQGDLAQETITLCENQIKEIDSEFLLAENHKVQAEIQLARCEYSKALQTAQQAAELGAHLGNHNLEAAGWRIVSEIALRQGNMETAHATLNKAQQAMSNRTEEVESARLTAQEGRILMQEGQTDKAGISLRTAREIFIRLGANLELEHVEEILHRSE